MAGIGLKVVYLAPGETISYSKLLKLEEDGLHVILATFPKYSISENGVINLIEHGH